jgi:hypothetical protein
VILGVGVLRPHDPVIVRGRNRRGSFSPTAARMSLGGRQDHATFLNNKGKIVRRLNAELGQ